MNKGSEILQVCRNLRIETDVGYSALVIRPIATAAPAIRGASGSGRTAAAGTPFGGGSSCAAERRTGRARLRATGRSRSRCGRS